MAGATSCRCLSIWFTNILALNYLAKNRIAPFAVSGTYQEVQKIIVSCIDEKLRAGAEMGVSLVRARAMVYFHSFRPLFASLRIGARVVGFSFFIFAGEPPP